MENNTLVDSNMNLQIKLEKLESKAFLLQQQISFITKNSLSKRPFKHRCDLDMPDFDQGSEILETGDETNICQEALKLDMEKLSNFLITCVPRTGATTMNRSYSAPKLNSLAISYNEMDENGCQKMESGKIEDEMQIE